MRRVITLRLGTRELESTREVFASTTVRGDGGAEPQDTVSGNMQTKRLHGCRRRLRSTVSRTTVDGVVFITRGSGVGANAPISYR